ncbi:MAG: alpha/beta hydrolase, partial [Bacilli bacterium]|nr:alpha/beta hydrolase [Bacilli bacterium]
EDAIIGLYGESMGAATVLEVMKYGQKIDFIIEDSGYSSLKKELEFQLRNLPPLKALLPICSILLKLFHGYRMEDVNAVEAAKDFRGPLLIMHGAADTFVPTSCAEEIAKGHKGYVEQHMFPDCDHTQAAGHANPEYTRIVRSFLERVSTNQ